LEYLLSLTIVGSTITPSITVPGFVTREVVKRRLITLKETKGFELEENDVTLKPGLPASKSICALPVVKVVESRLVGRATREQLVTLFANDTH